MPAPAESPVEFTPAEIAAIREMLVQRYRKEVEIHLADSDLMLDANDGDDDGDGDGDGERGAITAATVYWHERDANFVVFKIAPSRYRAQFFYTPHEQFGAGIEEYDDLDQCVAATLQAQSDHERERAGLER
ncbi:MAG: hypothetical protein ACR2P7_09210 [bacterium]